MKKQLSLIIAFTLFALTSASYAQYTVMHNFDGSTTEGEFPTGSLINVGGELYGMTFNSATGLGSSLFKINPNGTGFTRVIGFGFDSDGLGPHGSLAYDGTFLYGMTNQGGNNNKGILFKVKPDGTAYLKLHDFDGALSGSYPTGDLFIDGNYLYGMTPSDGVNGYGTIFKIMNDGTGFLKLRDFASATDGGNPNGSFISDGTYLYGMTYAGGANGGGTIFKVMEDGSGFTVIHNLSSTVDGRYPTGSLMYDGTYMYGMTQYGGSSNFGTIFKIMPDGTNFTTLLSFNGTNGKKPYGNVITDGTLLYGMTNNGGTSGPGGTLFSIYPDGSGFTELYDFYNLGAYYPQGSPLLVGGSLYGMIEQGGSFSKGVIFAAGISTGITEKVAADAPEFSPNPFSSSLTIKFNAEQNNTSIKITDLLGNEIKTISFSGKSLLLEKGEMCAGIYFVQITDNKNKVFNKKVVIQ